MLIQNLKPIKNKLEIVEEKIDQLLNSANPTGVTFTPLTLQPTYQLGSSNGWMIEPQNLNTLYDNDQSSASNLFQVGGGSWVYGEVILLPGISIPNYSRVQMKLGIRNSNNTRSLFELAAFNVAVNAYINFWSSIENTSATQDVIVNVDIILPYIWDKVRFRLWDVGQYFAQARFYDLKVWEVS